MQWEKQIKKYNADINLTRSLVIVLGLLNINAFISFSLLVFFWKIFWLLWVYFFISLGLLWYNIFYFWKVCKRYEGVVWYMFSLLSGIFASPFGIALLYYGFLDFYWKINPKYLSNEKEIKTVGKLFDFKIKKILIMWQDACRHINKIDKSIIEDGLNKKTLNFDEWNVWEIGYIIALSNLLNQFKQNDLNQIYWQPHWFNDVTFNFAIQNQNTKKIDNKYPYSVGVIVLNELNNYRLIFTVKENIKRNLKFSPAKIIYLQIADQYYIFINE